MGNIACHGGNAGDGRAAILPARTVLRDGAAWATANPSTRAQEPLPTLEAANLSIFSIPDLSQIKDVAGMKGAKTGKIHILYG